MTEPYVPAARRLPRSGVRAALVPALLALVAVLAAACSSDEALRIDCPAVRIPADTERLTRYREGGGRDITDVRLQAEVKFLSGECEIEEDRIVMSFPIAVAAKRGPANEEGKSEVSLFMAVTTPDREILTRRALPITLRFPGNRTQVVASETVSVDIPKDPEQTVGDFVVFLGFELSRAELRYNRQEERR